MTDSAAAESSSLETREEATAIGGEAKFWQGQLALAEADHREWIKEGKLLVERYKGEKEKTVRGSKRFNILYANTETLKAALFARMAKPDIRRRFADKDAVGRQIAEIVERSAIYCDDSYDADREFEAAIEDYLLPGRAVVRVKYEAETAIEGPKEYVAEQKLYDEHVCWDDFRHEPSRKWGKVTWIAFRHLMNRSALRENFAESLGNEEVSKIPLNWSPKAGDDKLPDAFKRAEVWEIWDKELRQRVWIVGGYPNVCRKDTDPYGLEDFFPIAEPLQAITANDTLIPTPEFESYRDQADGLDEIENRIDRLTRALKRRGIYDATIKELAQLAKAGDNQFLPVKNYAELTTKGGLAAAFQVEDLKVIGEVLTALHAQRDLRIQTIYEVIGIADIMRGASDPRETLGAQKIKAQFGGNRLKKRQDKVQKWIRNTLRIKAEIIAEHFEPQKLAEMTGFQWEPVPPQPAQMSLLPTGSQMPQLPGMLSAGGQGLPPLMSSMPSGVSGLGAPPSVEGKITPEMIQILRSDKLRSYRIDIETDSTVFEDAEQEKAARTELLKSMSEFMTAWVPIVAGQPALLPLAFEMLAFGVRGFKAGRQLEESIAQAKMQLEEAAKGPPPPNPEVQKAEIEMQMQERELQIKEKELALKQQAEEAKLQLEAQKAQLEMQVRQAESQQKMQLAAQEAAQKAQLTQQQAEIDGQAKRQQAVQKIELDAQMGAEKMRQMQVENDMSCRMMQQKADAEERRREQSFRREEEDNAAFRRKKQDNELKRDEERAKKPSRIRVIERDNKDRPSVYERS